MDLARELLDEIRRIDQQRRQVKKRLTTLVAASKNFDHRRLRNWAGRRGHRRQLCR
jgi:hypothetical protein